MLKIKAWCLSMVTAALVLCFSLIGVHSAQPVIDIRNTPRITHLGGLSPQSPPGELFYCEEDGLRQIDVPFVAIARSRHAQVTLQLRAVSKSSGTQPMLVRSIDHAEKDSKAITGWINSIADLHRHKPAPSVRYSKPMPDTSDPSPPSPLHIKTICPR